MLVITDCCLPVLILRPFHVSQTCLALLLIELFYYSIIMVYNNGAEVIGII